MTTAAATLTVEWAACVDGLRESYLLADENYKYLGTLQEFLMVSGEAGCLCGSEWMADGQNTVD